MDCYDGLKQRFARAAVIREAAGVLDWDMQIMMPPAGAVARGEQIAALAAVAHDIVAAVATRDLLGEAELRATALGDWDRRNLALMRGEHRRAAAVPADLVAATARANTACESAWGEARRHARFADLLGLFGEVVRLQRETAAALAAALGVTPYEALMQGYRPGLSEAEVGPLIGRCSEFVAAVLPRIEALQADWPGSALPGGPFAVAAQERLGRELAERLGFDFARGRLDRAAHPYCGGSGADIRVAARYVEDDPWYPLFSVAHEVGHARYEAGLPAEYARQPVGRLAGKAADESQALVVEVHACQTAAFARWIAPRLGAAFGGVWAPAELVRQWRRITRSPTRGGADEVTYLLHIRLRFELERALVAGDLAPADLPGAWNERIKNLLGIVPPDDRLGCLQDVHWYAGYYGYFPLYALGAVAAAQFMAAARRSEPGLDAAIAAGSFAPLMGWLHRAVHAWGSRLEFGDLVRTATGKSLGTEDFEAHIAARYLAD